MKIGFVNLQMLDLNSHGCFRACWAVSTKFEIGRFSEEFNRRFNLKICFNWSSRWNRQPLQMDQSESLSRNAYNIALIPEQVQTPTPIYGICSSAHIWRCPWTLVAVGHFPTGWLQLLSNSSPSCHMAHPLWALNSCTIQHFESLAPLASERPQGLTAYSEHQLVRAVTSVQ